MQNGHGTACKKEGEDKTKNGGKRGLLSKAATVAVKVGFKVGSGGEKGAEARRADAVRIIEVTGLGGENQDGAGDRVRYRSSVSDGLGYLDSQ